MYAEIDEASRRSLSVDRFASDYHEAMRTATATGLRVIRQASRASGGSVAAPVRVRTRLFGTLAPERAREDRQRRRRRRRDRLVALAGVPGMRARRDAQPPHDAAAASDAARARRLGPGRRRGDRRRPAQLAARRIGERRDRRSRPDPELPPRGARSAGRALRCGRRHERARAGARRAPARNARRRAARRGARARKHDPTRRARRPHETSHRKSRAPPSAPLGSRLGGVVALQAPGGPDPRGRGDRPRQRASHRARRSRWSRSQAFWTRTSRPRTRSIRARPRTFDGVES